MRLLRPIVQSLVFALVTTCFVVMPTIETANAWSTGDNYPAKWRNVAMDTTPDDWHHWNRECTSWASWALHDRNGYEMPFHDNAENWGARAAALEPPVPVNNVPAIGAIAWWSTSVKHVAWVSTVSSDGKTITIEDYNGVDSNGNGSYGDDGTYDKRTISASSPSGYIHFKDLSASPNPTASTPTSNTILRAKKRTFGSAQQVWTATKHGVYVDEWYPGSGGIHHSKVYTAKADEEIVDFDKINQPDGVTQNLYVATKSTQAGSHGRVWEVWWNGGGYSEPAKLFDHDGMKRVVADLQQSSSTLTHRLYVLANDGPYEYWWRAGTGVSSGYLLWNIAGGIDIVKNVGIDGKDEVFVATPSNVYSMKWPVNGGVQQKVVTQLASTVGIAVQNKGTTELLYTATKTGVHETWWNTAKPVGWFSDPAKVITVPGSETVVGIQERLYGNVQHIYLATTGNVYRYLSGSGGFGSPALVVGVDPSTVTTLDASADPTNSNIRQVYIVHKSFILERYWTGDAGTVQGGEPIVALGQDE